jgi:hypothetical protein
MIYHGYFIVDNVPVNLVQIDSLLENRLIVTVERKAGGVVVAGALERAPFSAKSFDATDG